MRQRLSPEVERLWNAPLSPDEFRRRVDAAIEELNGDEYENIRGLIDWFRRRYPTPLDRLRYARAKYAQAVALSGAAYRDSGE